jgi:small conductance mechanosensitive channel
MGEPIEKLEQARSTLTDLAILYGPRVLAALLVLLAGFVVGRWLGNALERLLQRLELDVTVRILLVRMTRAAIMVLFGIMALQNLGVELLPLIAGLGVAGAGIALALQGVLGNVAAGLTIIFTRPFKVGQYISIAGEEGRVEAITLVSTTLSHPDRSLVVIPNRKIVGEVLHNYGDIRQLDLRVGVAYDTDLGSAISVVKDLLAGNGRVLPDPPPAIQVASLADSSIEIAVRPWVNVPDFGAARGELNRAIVESFRNKSIVIPFPQREVRVLGSEARPGQS